MQGPRPCAPGWGLRVAGSPFTSLPRVCLLDIHLLWFL